MAHELFGKLRFKEADESWAGSAALPRFAAVGMMPEPAPMTEEEAAQMAADMNLALENIKAQMRERYGDQVEKAFEEVDHAADEAERKAREEEVAAPDPKDAEREQKRAARREKNAALLAKGRFPVRIAGPGAAEPTPAQEAAFRFLLENEPAVYDAVLQQLWEMTRVPKVDMIAPKSTPTMPT